MKNYIQILGFIIFFHTAVSCASDVNEIVFKIPDDFRGPIMVKPEDNVEQPFDGMLIPDQNGDVQVSDKGFWNDYRLSARWENGDKMKVFSIRDEVDGATVAFWELPSGVGLKYFYVGKREEMENWYAGIIILLGRMPGTILFEQREVVEKIKTQHLGKIKTQHLGAAILTYNLLLNTQELNIHQLRGAIGNQVFVHDDGREVVFDSEGNLVKDGINDGSYNYAHPTQDPIMHFVLDILPWLILGNTRQDPTTLSERLEAYVKDLENGLIRMRRSKIRNLDIESLKKFELEAIGVFHSAIGTAGFNKISDFLKENQPTSEDLDAIMKELFQGLLDVISGNYPRAPDSGNDPQD